MLLATGGAAGPSCLLEADHRRLRRTERVLSCESGRLVRAGDEPRKYSTETQNVTLGIDWYDGSKSSISSSTFDTALSNYSSGAE